MVWLRAVSRNALAAFLLLLVTLPLAGCEVIGDVFQAGMAVGVLMIVIVIAIIGFLVAKIRS